MELIKARVGSIILFLSLCLISLHAIAKWTFIGQNERANYYVDIETLKRGEEKSRAWFLADFRKPDQRSYRSRIMFKFANCSNEQIRTLADRYYYLQMGNGEIALKNNLPKDWVFIEEPNILMDYLCGNPNK